MHSVSYHRSHGHDENLVDRIRELVARESDLTEQTMFGGLAFLIRGNMAVAASGQGGMLVRVDPALSEALWRRRALAPWRCAGGQCRAGYGSAPEDPGTGDQIARWVELGMSYARSLPAKR